MEHNTVRFIDNFSAGTRGSASAEAFLDHGYAVIFLYRLKSLEPFVRHFTGYTFLDNLEIIPNSDNEAIQGCFKDFTFIIVIKSYNNSVSLNFPVKGDKVQEILPILQKYEKVKASDTLISIPFTTLADYLWLLRGCCECLTQCRGNALLYLAAAVSDFYIPLEKLVDINFILI